MTNPPEDRLDRIEMILDDIATFPSREKSRTVTQINRRLPTAEQDASFLGVAVLNKLLGT